MMEVSPGKFSAPWSTVVKVISALVTVLLIGISIAVSQNFGVTIAAAVLPVVVLGGSALFTVRGFEIVGSEILVQRLLWQTRIDLGGVERIWASALAMEKSWRVFGNGGLYSISGLFRNRRLGSYRAFAVDPKNAVVLEWEDHRVVVTPGRPLDFVEALQRAGFDAAVVAGREKIEKQA
ncbi:MAG: PH domain-containing protein [Thermoanaerobaculia bacterium]|nr:PH domain-containing protein [Thermoanaerobaculia bacterium]